MHCPVCGQLQVTEETRFCSRCGFLLTGVAQLVTKGGVIDGPVDDSRTTTPRNRGLKQGLFIFLLSFLIVPIIAILTVASGGEPYAVVIAAILLTVGGLLRAAYAFMFQSNSYAPNVDLASPSQRAMTGSAGTAALPAQHSTPASEYITPGGLWKETNELAVPPPSVIDNTTKLLQKEQDNQ